MGILERPNQQLGLWLIADLDRKDQQEVRLRHGLVAGWVGIAATTALFVVKIALGLRSGSVSIVASAFHLLSHLANSVIRVVSFVIGESPERIIIAADIDAAEKISEHEFERIADELGARVMERIPNVAYCTFYVTPKFAY
jgi:divalent metal cation (Fe/Co/Zn/Cd) transporter